MEKYDPVAVFDDVARAYTKRVEVVACDARRGPYKVVTTVDVNTGDVLLLESALAFESKFLIADFEHPLVPILFNNNNNNNEDELRPLEFVNGDQIFEFPSLATLENNLRRDKKIDIPTFLSQWHHFPGEEDPVEAVCTANALPLAIVTGGLRYGRGFYTEASRINHSCDPNAEILCHGRQIVVYALRPIRRGEEVTITYCGDFPDYPRNIRRPSLQTQLGFDCICERCCRPERPYTPAEMALHNNAQRWRKIIYDQIPELSTEAFSLAPRSRIKALRLSLVFLQQNKMFAAATPGTRRYVTKALANILTPLNVKVLLEDQKPWMALYTMAYPLFLAEENKTRWYVGLRYCATIVNIVNIKKIRVPILPEIASPLALFAGNQYVAHGVTTSTKHQFMANLLHLADAVVTARAKDE